jgi:fumarate reductase subunit D
VKRSNEPLFWSLFGAGGVVAALALPALIFVTGIAAPLGIMPADTMSYGRMTAFVGGWFGKLFVFGVISLTFWHAFHRIYHSLHDLGVHAGLGFFKILAYSIAFVGTLGVGYYVLAV